MSIKMTPEQFRDTFRVSVGTLPTGWKIEVVAVKVTTENYRELLTHREFDKYLETLYGSNYYYIAQRLCCEGDWYVFTYRENG